MSALHHAGLPVPAIRVMSSDPVIDGRPFILMEAIEGTRIEKTGVEQKPLDIAASAVRVLKRLHALPLERTGIGEEAPVSLQAEMLRWLWLMERAPQELTGRAGELGGLLAADIPQERQPTLVHGDYHYGNMLFRGPDVVAVLDWEIAQIGQPLLDLGCLCTLPHRRKYEGAPNPGARSRRRQSRTCSGCMASTPARCRWYVAMSLYKYAAILGYNLMLHRRGNAPIPCTKG
jgi:aminoglycoside phosphotransferase (APT) family kinase protein